MCFSGGNNISGGKWMLKRKLSTLILATTITNLVATPVNVFAETLTRNNIIETNEVEKENKTNKATITKFILSYSSFYY